MTKDGTLEQNNLYAEHVKKIFNCFNVVAATSIYRGVEEHFEAYAISLFRLPKKKKDKMIVTDPETRKNLKVDAIIRKYENRKDLTASDEEAYTKAIREKLKGYMETEADRRAFLDNLDAQAYMKSLTFIFENVNMMRKHFPAINKDICQACMTVRNKYVGHDKVNTFKGWEPKDIDKNVIHPLSAYVNAVENIEYPEVMEAVDAFHEQCERTLQDIGYPPLPIADYAQRIGIDVEAMKKFALEKRFVVKGGFILATSEKTLMDEYQAYSGSALQTPVTAKKHFPPLQYLQSYEKGEITALQRTELFTMYNVILDESVLMNKDTQHYLAYEILPFLKRKERVLFVDRATRYRVCEKEERYRRMKEQILAYRRAKEEGTALDMPALYREELEMNDQEYSDICQEYERAKECRLRLDRWKKDHLIVYVTMGPSVSNTSANIVHFIKHYEDRRFVVFTQESTLAAQLQQLRRPSICAIRIIGRDAMRVWKAFIPYFKLDHNDPWKVAQSTHTQSTTPTQVPDTLKRQDVQKETTGKEITQPQGKKEEITVKKTEKPKLKSEPTPRISFAMAQTAVSEVDEELPLEGTIPAKNEYAYLQDGTRIHLRQVLGEGGEGIVYSTDQPEDVAKIYFKNRITKQRKAKLELMTSKNPGIASVCWPTALLYNKQKEFIGYLMPNAAGGKEIGLSIMKIGSETVRNEILPHWNRLDLVKSARALSEVFEELHKRNILIGDVNVRNILIYPQDSTKVCFVDCDSYQVEQYPCPVGTLEFTAPTIYKRCNSDTPDYTKIMRTRQDEEYALASMLFQILMLGQAPYVSKLDTRDVIEAIKNYTFSYRSKRSDNGDNSGKNVPDGPFRMIWNNTPKYVREAFEDVFTGVKTHSAKKWKDYLSKYQYQIEHEVFTKELKPIKYFSKGFEDSFKTFTCEECGTEANMPIDRYHWKQEKNQKILCNDCQRVYNLLQKTPCKVICDRCHDSFESNKLFVQLAARDHKATLCPTCRQRGGKRR